MDWNCGDWSRILIHDVSSSTHCSEQTLSAFQYMEDHFLATTEGSSLGSFPEWLLKI